MKTLLLIPLLFFFFSIQSRAQDWKTRPEKDGIVVSTRQKTDGLQELKLQTTWQASLTTIVAMMIDLENYPRWAYKVIEGRTLEKRSDTEFMNYTKIDFPWPMSDRDLVMHVRILQDSKTRIVTIEAKSEPTYLPENQGVVRIKNAYSKWTFEPKSDGTVAVEYFLNSDPGGLLPDWAVNMGTEIGPLETLKSAKNRLTEEKYRVAKLAFVKN